MKRLLTLVLFSVALAAGPALTSCTTAPSARTQEVTTLKIIGASADTTMRLAAQLYHDGKISADQWNRIATLHDGTFLPAYNAAVAAVQANLDSVASPDIVNLASTLSQLLTQFQAAHP